MWVAYSNPKTTRMRVLVLLLCFLPISFSVSGGTCTSGAFTFQISLDEQPSRISWIIEELIEFEAQTIRISPPYSDDTDASQLYTYSECLDSSKCYRFQIHDFYVNGFCCEFGNGNYTVIYDGTIIIKSTKFEDASEFESIMFGLGCTSLSPSFSLPPLSPSSLQLKFDTSPSISPFLPKVATSFASSLSPIPFSNNTARYRYPQQLVNQGTSRQMVPDCSAEDGRVGCLAVPNTVSHPPPPQWAGTIHFTPPKCGNSTFCKMGLPMTTRLFADEIRKTSNVGFEDTTFEMIEEIREGIRVSTLEIGDMNNDGFLDIVLGCFDAENEIWMNLGNGTYSKSKLPGGRERTSSIALGDLDGNGFLDIFVGNLFSSSQVVLNINGTFVNNTIELPASIWSTKAVALGDMNANGKLDVIATIEVIRNTVLYSGYGILLNSGDGISYDLIMIPAKDRDSVSLAVGDLNRDGNLDILFANRNEANTILMNNGNVSFNETILDSNNKEEDSNSIELGDINGDGFLDIVVGNLRGSDKLYENNGDGTYKKKILPHGRTNTMSIALGDVNGDGRVDIVISVIEGTTKVVENILLQNNGYNFESLQFLPSPSANIFSSAIVRLGDMNNDGFVDALTAYTGGVLLLMNSIRGKYETKNLPSRDTKNFMPVAVVLEDMNGDGLMDIVVASEMNNEVYILNGSGKYDTVYLPGENQFNTAIAVGDLNGDNQVDIVVGKNGKTDQILMSTGQDTNGKIYDYDIKDLSNSSARTQAIALGDLDGDNFLDIVVADENGENKILFNTGNGAFEESIVFNNGGDFTTSVALGDLDGNGQLDIVFGSVQLNRAVMNYGNRTFTVSELPSKEDYVKTDIKLGDLDGNNILDIVIANYGGGNQVLINDGHGNFTVFDLPDFITSNGESITTSIALGDMDGNGFLDIVVGNRESKNFLLLNPGGTFNNTNFLIEPLIDGSLEGQNPLRTQDIAVGDLDKDGVLEVIIMNQKSSAQVVFYSSCPRGGAQLHSRSWCFHCPNYMGRPTFLDHEVSACLECMPDYMQQTGIGEQCSKYPCPYEERQLGNKDCKRCGSGKYHDSHLVREEINETSWELERCVKCPTGNTANGSVLVIDRCIPCKPGEYQDEEGQSSCKQCSPGKFQPTRGQAECEDCALGGYCNSSNVCGGGFTSCPQGTFNDRSGMSNLADCKECPVGTFSTTPEANSSSTCEKCNPGSFSNETGQTSCLLCREGAYQDNFEATSCKVCEEGYYADKIGLEGCIPCPYRLSSSQGSNTCSLCAKDFFLKKVPASEGEMFGQPDNYCVECPLNAVCPSNTTLQTIKVKEGYWRDSLNTSKLYKCNNDVCEGSQIVNTRRLSSGSDHDSYCALGHIGPRCEVCLNKMQHFSRSEGRCVNCPGQWRLFIPFIVVAIVIAVIVAVRAITMYPFFREIFDKCQVLFSNLGAQTKFKIFISFYQVVTVLTPVYGVEMNYKFQRWFDFLDYFNFGFIKLARFPQECIGSMAQRLVIGAVWPFFIMFAGFVGIVIHALFLRRKERLTSSSTDDNLRSVFKKVGFRTLYFITIFTYIILPGVSRGIFNAVKCASFQTSDDPKIKPSSYLISDLEIQCERFENSEFEVITRIFIGLFCLWPLLMPLVMSALLWKVKNAVRSKQTTDLAEACSFLWRDYNENMMFWEVLELYRKIILTGLILWVDLENGSSKVLRLLVAILVLMLYFGILSRSRPFKRRNDLDLAFVSTILLLCCFILGIALHFCQRDSEEVCRLYIGDSFNSYNMTLWTVILTAVMMGITVLSLLMIAVNAIVSPTVRLVSSGSRPNLEMPADCKFHAFFSHTWSTGQDKTHTIVRKLQLLIPGVRIWLDVDELKNMDELEHSVGNCVVFFIFYSSNYFRSKNCRREIYAAVSQGKPIHIIYTGDDSVLDEMKNDCCKYCKTEGWDSDVIIQSIFNEEPTLWLGDGSTHFALESIKLISLCILSHLPFYKRVPGQLNQGISVVGELGPVGLSSPVDVLFCAANTNARMVAEEMRNTLIRNSDLMNIHEISSFLQALKTDNDMLTKGFKNTFLLLYLDEDVFQDEEDEVTNFVRDSVDIGIKIVSVHERDSSVGGCSFDVFFSQTPQDLIDAPYQIFKEIAVPLYALDTYRKVSLRQLLIRLGASEIYKTSSAATSVLSASVKSNVKRSFNSIRLSLLGPQLSQS